MTYRSFLFSRRVFRWSFLGYFEGADDLLHSLSLEPTASRRTILLFMDSTRQSAATRVLARGGSSWSRYMLSEMIERFGYESQFWGQVLRSSYHP
jgi:hypothetical protein